MFSQNMSQIKVLKHVFSWLKALSKGLEPTEHV